MSVRRRQEQKRRARPGAAVVLDEDPRGGADDEEILCTCCDPKNPLVLRPDLGVLGDGSAEYALCVLHEPQPVVYRNRGDGIYEQARHLSLNAAGELVDHDGDIVARVAGDGFQRLSTVDDEPLQPDGGAGAGPASGSSPSPRPGGAARPATYHVDLSQDDFYRRR